MVTWLKKVRLNTKLQQVDDVASLLTLYLEGDTLALYMGTDGGRHLGTGISSQDEMW